MKKKVPTFKTDAAAENFVATANLGDYDLAGFKPVQFEFEKKGARSASHPPRPVRRRGDSREA